jgi:hypothetical protein
MVTSFRSLQLATKHWLMKGVNMENNLHKVFLLNIYFHAQLVWKKIALSHTKCSMVKERKKNMNHDFIWENKHEMEHKNHLCTKLKLTLWHFQFFCKSISLIQLFQYHMWSFVLLSWGFCYSLVFENKKSHHFPTKWKNKFMWSICKQVH